MGLPWEISICVVVSLSFRQLLYLLTVLLHGDNVGQLPLNPTKGYKHAFALPHVSALWTCYIIHLHFNIVQSLGKSGICKRS